MFGLGALGAGHDVVNPGAGALNAPVFEMRRMMGGGMLGIGVHGFTEQALGVFDYVRALNSAGAGVHPAAYTRSARPVSVPTNSQRLRFAIL
jgi:hypothetical protein